MRFLCERLCGINASGLARITWNTFYQTLQNSLQVFCMIQKEALYAETYV